MVAVKIRRDISFFIGTSAVEAEELSFFGNHLEDRGPMTDGLYKWVICPWWSFFVPKTWSNMEIFPFQVAVFQFMAYKKGGLTLLYGCFQKWWYPTTMGFPTKNDHFGVFWGYPYFWKHPYTYKSWGWSSKQQLTDKNINGVRSWMGACSVDRTLLAFGIVSFRRPLVPADRTSECARPSMVTWRWGQESAIWGYGLNFLEPDETPESMVKKRSSAFGMAPHSRLPYQCVGKATDL